MAGYLRRRYHDLFDGAALQHKMLAAALCAALHIWSSEFLRQVIMNRTFSGANS
jgi:hypothetical protein